jgi:hypothetical protein
MAFSVTSARVQHYDDVVEYMANTEIERFKSENGRLPTESQVKFLKKELVRHAVIRHDINTANKIRLSKNTILNEENSSQAKCKHIKVGENK